MNTIPEGTLKALADHGEIGAMLPADGGDSEEMLARFAKAGIDVDALAARLQDEGAKAFVKSWNGLMGVIASKSAAALAKAGRSGSDNHGDRRRERQPMTARPARRSTRTDAPRATGMEGASKTPLPDSPGIASPEVVRGRSQTRRADDR